MYVNLGNVIDPATGQPRTLPWVWNELYLCQHVYHCTPEELDRQDWDRVQMHIKILNLKTEAEELRQQHARKK